MANEFEKSISVQRDLIYKERNRILDMVDKTNLIIINWRKMFLEAI